MTEQAAPPAVLVPFTSLFSDTVCKARYGVAYLRSICSQAGIMSARPIRMRMPSRSTAPSTSVSALSPCRSSARRSSPSEAGRLHGR